MDLLNLLLINKHSLFYGLIFSPPDLSLTEILCDRSEGILCEDVSVMSS